MEKKFYKIETWIPVVAIKAEKMKKCSKKKIFWLHLDLKVLYPKGF
jgi:hypothetical protein